MPLHEWTFNDGWILMSVFLAANGAGAALPELIGAADMMNHAVPTKGELSRALTRLARIGVITITAGRFVIAPEWIPEIKRASHGKGGLFSLPEKGKKWLSQNDFPETEAAITISDEELSDAVTLYLKMLQL